MARTAPREEKENIWEGNMGQKMRIGDLRQGVLLKCGGGNAEGAFLHWKLG